MHVLVVECFFFQVSFFQYLSESGVFFSHHTNVKIQNPTLHESSVIPTAQEYVASMW
jgi:hypothetical protein